MASKQGMACNNHVDTESTIAVAPIRALYERQELLLKSRMVPPRECRLPEWKFVSSTIDAVSEVDE